MPELAFSVCGARAPAEAALPVVALELEVATRPAGARVRAGLVQCQVRIEPFARAYSAREAEALRELFGDRERWGTVQSQVWFIVPLQLPAFDGQTTVEARLPCGHDFQAGVPKYLCALEGGAIPLRLLFSGTLFGERPDGSLQIEMVPWSTEATYLLDLRVCREAMERHSPGRVDLRLDRAAFDRLSQFKASEGLATFEGAIERLLERAGAGVAR